MMMGFASEDKSTLNQHENLDCLRFKASTTKRYGISSPREYTFNSDSRS